MDADGATKPTERWRSRIGVIFAVAGSAVGLGNFLRFPGQAAEHGGGAFMIPYFCALLLLGIPIAWVEWTIGRLGGAKRLHSAPGILGVVGRGKPARYLGTVGVLIPLVVYMYYAIIESWCLRYTWEYLIGAVDLGEPGRQAAQSLALFNAVTGADRNGVLLAGGGLHPSVGFWAIVFLLNLWLIYRGIARGIESFVRVAVPGMALCAVLVLARVLTLGSPDPSHPERSLLDGLGFMWNPAPAKLVHFETWLAAAGQIFFSLSVGFGIVINYASYLRRRDDVVLSALTSSATNEVFEVGFGGMITIPAAFVFLGAGGAVGGTFALGFQALPVVFEHMGPLGRWVGALWFFMLFLAAITSSISMLQPVRAFLSESVGLSHGRAVLLLALVEGLGSFEVLYFSKDLVALNTMDFWVGTTFIFIMAAVQVICFAWVLGTDRGLAAAHRGAALRIPRIYRPVMKYVAPAFLIVVFVGFCIQSLPGKLTQAISDGVVGGTMLLVGMILAGLLALTRLGEKRWRAEGLDLDGRVLPQAEREGAAG